MDAIGRRSQARGVNLPPALRSVALDQDGVFTTAQARAADLSPLEITRLVRTGEWTRIRRGAYTHLRWSLLDAEQRHLLHARAVMLRLTSEAVLSHHSAAAFHRMRGRAPFEPRS